MIAMKNNENKKRQKIPVVVVEQHQHACEHIHQVLRQRRRCDAWSMVHYDAHPDLACPHGSIPAAACFRPNENDLYELLDSTATGIAEWILPLVLAANLTRVHWIRPTEQPVEQLPLGEDVYHVGA
jgi:hypothetical protein